MALAFVEGSGFTVHGLRSNFKDWATDESDYSYDVVETALSHAVGDEIDLDGKPEEQHPPPHQSDIAKRARDAQRRLTR